MNEAFIWLSRHRFIDREIFTENNPARGTRKNIICPTLSVYLQTLYKLAISYWPVGKGEEHIHPIIVTSPSPAVLLKIT